LDTLVVIAIDRLSATRSASLGLNQSIMRSASMSPLAAIYHPGAADPNGYPVSVVDFISSWSEATGTVTQVVCVTTDGAIHTFDAARIQLVDRSVAESIVAAAEAYERQRGQYGTLPPAR
jgi:hypothetical protein